MPQLSPTACNSGIDRYDPASPKVFDFAHLLTKSQGKSRLVRLHLDNATVNFPDRHGADENPVNIQIVPPSREQWMWARPAQFRQNVGVEQICAHSWSFRRLEINWWGKRWPVARTDQFVQVNVETRDRPCESFL
ncbi:hypothetical protein GGE65_005819 [Skermanella aerolata]|uniref:hypothetical protein n=1 Tax=Skermanella aerolata TaxID=393310 RepID=UPI003D1DBD6E